MILRIKSCGISQTTVRWLNNQPKVYLLIQQPKQLAMLTYKAFQQLMTASVKFNLVPLSFLLWAQIYKRKLSDRVYMQARIVSTAFSYL